MVDVILRRRIAIFSRLSSSTFTLHSFICFFVVVFVGFVLVCLIIFTSCWFIFPAAMEKCVTKCVTNAAKTRQWKISKQTIKQFFYMYRLYSLQNRTYLLHSYSHCCLQGREIWRKKNDCSIAAANSHCQTFVVNASKYIKREFLLLCDLFFFLSLYFFVGSKLAVKCFNVVFVYVNALQVYIF